MLRVRWAHRSSCVSSHRFSAACTSDRAASDSTQRLDQGEGAKLSGRRRSLPRSGPSSSGACLPRRNLSLAPRARRRPERLGVAALTRGATRMGISQRKCGQLGESVRPWHWCVSVVCSAQVTTSLTNPSGQNAHSTTASSELSPQQSTTTWLSQCRSAAGANGDQRLRKFIYLYLLATVLCASLSPNSCLPSFLACPPPSLAAPTLSVSPLPSVDHPDPVSLESESSLSSSSDESGRQVPHS